MQSPPARADATRVSILSPVLARPGASPRSTWLSTSWLKPRRPARVTGRITVAAYLRGVRWKLLLQNESTGATRLFLIEQTGTALVRLLLIGYLALATALGGLFGWPQERALERADPRRGRAGRLEIKTRARAQLALSRQAQAWILDEVVQVGILALRDKLRLGTILATIALQRTFEFATTVLVLGAGALLLPQLRQFLPWIAIGVVFGSASLVALFAVGPLLSRIRILSNIQIVSQFASAVMLLRRQKSLALAAFLISIAQAGLLGVVGWLVVLATDLQVGLPAMIVITMSITFFSSTVPGLPMSIGTFEFAAVSILALWGVGREDAIAFAIMLHVVLFLPPILFAIVFLPREGLLSIRELRNLTTRTRARMSTASRSTEPV